MENISNKLQEKYHEMLGRLYNMEYKFDGLFDLLDGRDSYDKLYDGLEESMIIQLDECLDTGIKGQLLKFSKY